MSQNFFETFFSDFAKLFEDSIETIELVCIGMIDLIDPIRSATIDSIWFGLFIDVYFVFGSRPDIQTHLDI